MRKIVEGSGVINVIGIILLLTLVGVGYLTDYTGKAQSVKELFFDKPPWINNIVDGFKLISLALATLYGLGLFSS